MTSLREARDHGKLEEFIREREGQAGSAAALDKTITAMAGKGGKGGAGEEKR